jgi:hypothetical protein
MYSVDVACSSECICEYGQAEMQWTGYFKKAVEAMKPSLCKNIAVGWAALKINFDPFLYSLQMELDVFARIRCVPSSFQVIPYIMFRHGDSPLQSCACHTAKTGITLLSLHSVKQPTRHAIKCFQWTCSNQWDMSPHIAPYTTLLHDKLCLTK